MSERINEASNAPAVWLVADRPNLSGSRYNRPFNSSVEVCDRHHHSHRASAKRSRAEIQMLRRFVRQLELGSSDREPGNNLSSFVLDAEDLHSAESRPVKVDGTRSVSD